MKFNNEDTAYFYHNSDKEYGWELKPYEKVTIKEKGFDRKGEMYYTVKTSDSSVSSWYFEDDMISEQEMRKRKMYKIYEKIT